MKRIILLVFAASVCTFANAQRHKVSDDALDKKVLEVAIEGPAMAALDLQQELDLTQEQYAQVISLHKKRFEQIRKAEQQYEGDALLRSKSIYTINQETDKSLSALLDAKQLSLYQELEGHKQIHLVSDSPEK